MVNGDWGKDIYQWTWIITVQVTARLALAGHHGPMPGVLIMRN
ncbi:MAG: hypothetical protein A4E53_01402 [Pelotomaculum sp. PtaB.Bin104]|nr:MAG: hypothetical protein A4E53_01402 [Pelotomaculum sp. PtaB.Bin104]